MADGERGEGSWLIDPPAPGHILLHVVTGDGVELGDEQRAAIEDLIARLGGGDEVAGFDKCMSKCAPFISCKPKACIELSPCSEFNSCAICQLAELGRLY
jgi:hypothetical protein